MQILRESEDLQSQADAILKESKVLDIFSSSGKVHLAGSYRLRLLVRPDIDIIVTAEGPSREKAVAATKQLLDDGYFQSVVFIDHLSWQERLDAKMDAHGFYWHLDLPKYGKQWKCDVWYLCPKEDLFVPQTERFEALLDQYPEARKSILRLKNELREGKGYRGKATGTRITSAVLEHGIVDSKGLETFLDGNTGI
ncbi:hypothetical protein ACFL1X_07000 [Candidatus Hydrogenedentota bacterium]